MNIYVLELRMLPGDKTTRAFVDVRLDDIVVRDFRVMQNGGKPYVRAPFQTYKNSVGEIQFRQIIDLPGEVRSQVDMAILGAFYRKKEEEGEHQPR